MNVLIYTLVNITQMHGWKATIMIKKNMNLLVFKFILRDKRVKRCLNFAFRSSLKRRATRHLLLIKYGCVIDYRPVFSGYHVSQLPLCSELPVLLQQR